MRIKKCIFGCLMGLGILSKGHVSANEIEALKIIIDTEDMTSQYKAATVLQTTYEQSYQALTQYVYSNQLYEDEVIVLAEGSLGKRRIEAKIIVQGNIEFGRLIEQEEIIETSVPRVVLKGKKIRE